MNAAGFTVLEIASMGAEEVPIPLLARIRSWFPGSDKLELGSNEIEPGTLRIVARRSEHGTVRCLARYYNGYIAAIVLRYPRGCRPDASDLRKALYSAYPHERIVLEEEPGA